MGEALQILIALNALANAAVEMGFNVERMLKMREDNNGGSLTLEQLAELEAERDRNLARL